MVLRLDHVVLERRERDERLDRRARRIGAAQRAVEQRLVRVLGERDVFGAGKAAREAIRVERRRADEGQHVAVRGSIATTAAAAADERLLGDALQLDVDGESRSLPAMRLVGLELRVRALGELDGPALGVHEQLAVATRAVQLVLVGALDAGLADDVVPK